MGKTLRELQEKAGEERNKTLKFQKRRALKSEISTSRRARRQARYGEVIKGARAVGRTTTGLSAAAVTLVGHAVRQSQKKSKPVARRPTYKKKKKKKRSSKK